MRQRTSKGVEYVTTDNLVHKSETDTTVSCDDKSVGHFCDIRLG
jgi:hypothetical protein